MGQEQGAVGDDSKEMEDVDFFLDVVVIVGVPVALLVVLHDVGVLPSFVAFHFVDA